jgi:hypothetical protein
LLAALKNPAYLCVPKTLSVLIGEGIT